MTIRTLVLAFLPASTALAQTPACQLHWQGEAGADLRATFDVRNGQPLIGELSIAKPGGRAVVLARNLTLQFDVVSGRRRVSQQQLNPLQALKVAITPDVIDREKWNAFWDAPLDLPGAPRANLDLPRLPPEIRRASAS